jgi:hypothetical protein
MTTKSQFILACLDFPEREHFQIPAHRNYAHAGCHHAADAVQLTCFRLAGGREFIHAYAGKFFQDGHGWFILFTGRPLWAGNVISFFRKILLPFGLREIAANPLTGFIAPRLRVHIP